MTALSHCDVGGAAGSGCGIFLLSRSTHPYPAPKNKPSSSCDCPRTSGCPTYKRFFFPPFDLHGEFAIMNIEETLNAAPEDPHPWQDQGYNQRKHTRPSEITAMGMSKKQCKDWAIYERDISKLPVRQVFGKFTIESLVSEDKGFRMALNNTTCDFENCEHGEENPRCIESGKTKMGENLDIQDTKICQHRRRRLDCISCTQKYDGEPVESKPACGESQQTTPWSCHSIRPLQTGQDCQSAQKCAPTTE